MISRVEYGDLLRRFGDKEIFKYSDYEEIKDFAILKVTEESVFGHKFDPETEENEVLWVSEVSMRCRNQTRGFSGQTTEWFSNYLAGLHLYTSMGFRPSKDEGEINMEML